MEAATLNINGMSCAHCEKFVKDALEEIGIKVEKISAKESMAEIVFNPETISLDEIKKIIVEEGYKVG